MIDPKSFGFFVPHLPFCHKTPHGMILDLYTMNPRF